MWDFDGDELAFFILSGIAAVILAARYFRPILMTSSLIVPSGVRLLLLVVPVACLAIILCVLWNWSDAQTVRGHADYMSLFMAGGALWVFATPAFLRLLGIGLRDDAIERKNPAAISVICGAMFNSALCYAGSNIGTGPTIWTTILPAAVAPAATLALWIVIELVTRISETITIDRHLPTGLVFGAFLTLSGLNLGWAMAGDWQSWSQTMIDFAKRGWPVLPLTVAVIIIIQIGKPRCTLVPTRQ